jgi:hypothetical protein
VNLHYRFQRKRNASIRPMTLGASTILIDGFTERDAIRGESFL